MTGLSHSAHDYATLVTRWHRVAEESGLILSTLCEVGGQPVLIAENSRSLQREAGGFYISAGVHGDECAPVWALLEWVASHPAALRDKPVMLFPCLNPVGLMQNTRHDGNGIDLNRSFSNSTHPLIGAWQQHLEGRSFDLSVNLHEDYDATGIYLYELERHGKRGDSLLAACEDLIPRESATEIDGSVFEQGLLLRTVEIEDVVADQLGGSYPEAFLLYLRHTERNYTFETPSEFDLTLRIATQRRFLDVVTQS